MDTKEYVSVADTAKLIRIDLKKNFPGVKFSVRSESYSGGASIDISWADGPCTQRVDKIVQSYSGASFDGMTDMKSYHDTVVVDASGAARKVHYGADYVFTHRSNTNEDARRAVLTEFVYTQCGGVSFASHDRQPNLDRWGNDWVADIVQRVLYGRDFEKETEQQAFERITMSRREITE